MTEVAMSRVDDIEARANTDLAVERNRYQPTEMMGVQQQYFVRIQKETLELIATIRALQEDLAEYERFRDMIILHSENQDMSHLDFRVHAGKHALTLKDPATESSDEPR